MRNLGRLVAVILLCGAGLASSTAVAQTPPDIHKVADAVDRHYNGLRSLEAGFTEVYAGAGMTRTESGTMWMKKPGKMRWEYTSPRQKLFVTDGKTAWFYVPGEKQARRTPVKKLADFRSPLRYMLGHTKLVKEFKGLSWAPDKKPRRAGDLMLRGVPNGMGDSVSQVLLEITPDYTIVGIEVEELDGSVTEFRFRDEKDNVQVPVGRFKFVPPPGVEVMDAQELEP